ncbi:MAG: ROK family protein [Actinomycetota bacterium]|nr:ROK family protein [Actinomycetota bacterium]
MTYEPVTEAETPAPPPAPLRRPSRARKRPVETLAVDVGGTGIKGSVLGPDGKMEHERVRVPTPYPLSPQVLIQTIDSLVRDLPTFDRIAVGFPGMVRDGKVLTAPHFLGLKGPDGKPEPKLVAAWTGFDLEGALATAFAKPARVANDADMQGAAVVAGDGLEMVVTLGTGVGTALFLRGQLLPHLELGHHPFTDGETYDQQLGDAARKKVGTKKWNKRVLAMIANFQRLVNYDHLFIGGGNGTKVDGELGPDVSLVDNTAGILGGINIWDRAVR